MDETPVTYSVLGDFHHCLHHGAELGEVVACAQYIQSEGRYQTVTIFNEATGESTDLDPRGGDADRQVVIERLSPPRPGPGRPKLGVISREISLLPRHWDWLNLQPGGASAAIRRLVDQARKEHPHEGEDRKAKDIACRFMGMVAGDLPGYEAANRALYAGRLAEVRTLTVAWPGGIGEMLGRLIDRAERLQELVRNPA